MSKLQIPRVELVTPWPEPGISKQASRLQSQLADITDVEGLQQLRRVFTNPSVIRATRPIQGVVLELQNSPETREAIDRRIAELTR